MYRTQRTHLAARVIGPCPMRPHENCEPCGTENKDERLRNRSRDGLPIGVAARRDVRLDAIAAAPVSVWEK